MVFFLKVPTLFFTILLSMLLVHQAVADGAVGVRQLSVPSKDRGINLDVTVWYPSGLGGTSIILGESPFFVGTPAMRDAPVAEGMFPLLLLSHGVGLGGNSQALSWLAMPLARQGVIVAAPTHPGNTGPHRSAVETMRLWLRPGDITAALDALQKASDFEGKVDSNKIGVLGLSMGGSTALALAGASIDPILLASYCDTDTRNPSLCEWLRQSDVDLHSMDLRTADRDAQDARIRFVMAIDPVPVDILDFKSFPRISIPVTLVNLGQPGNIPLTADASQLARAIPKATYSVIEDASHFSLLAECKPGAEAIAQSEKIDDPICTDGGGRTRGEIHAQLVDIAVAAFTQAFAVTP